MVQMKLMMFRSVILILAVNSVSGFRHFQEEIPNGDYIPHPCKPNFVWKGVGHINMQGGGTRNQFGLDFDANGKKWTETLCQMDSDRDGKTNGQELGDPNCAWTKGKVPERVTEITHPGICDPFESVKCKSKNAWVDCTSDEFNCPAIKKEGVKTVDLVYPLTNVPDAETTYMCMGFNLPTDDDYHLIATTPLLNETNVMHHIVLIGCADDAEVIDTPRKCSMGLKGCSKTIGLWTLGLPGECFYKEAGIRIGTKGLKKGVLQFHWTNPQLRSDYWDASGLRLHYTKNLRTYDASTWITGQNYLEIPPLSPKVVQQSTCSARCTRKTITESIFITTGLNHMHYLGVSQYVKLIRQNGSELMLTDDKHYSYDTPVLNTYDPPIEVRPGDALETVCTYRSLSRKKTAFSGEGTFDEMCFGIFGFYPVLNMKSDANCITHKEFEFCDFEAKNCSFVDIYNFTNPETKALVDSVLDVCAFDGRCLHGCRAVVNKVMTTHACFKDGIAEAMIFPTLGSKTQTDPLQLKFVAAMQSCGCKNESSIVYHGPPPSNIEEVKEPNSGSFRLMTSFISIIAGVAYAVIL